MTQVTLDSITFALLIQKLHTSPCQGFASEEEQWAHYLGSKVQA
jgi:hypothetical protein